MKKLLLVVILLIPLNAYAWQSFMDKCIASWIGYPLDSLIKSWGYPDDEKTIAGKKLLIFETYDTNYDAGGGVTVVSTDKKGNNTIISSGGGSEIEYCKTTFEIDENNIVIGGNSKGNACPAFYFMGKKLVNPANNPWVKK